MSITSDDFFSWPGGGGLKGMKLDNIKREFKKQKKSAFGRMSSMN